MKSIETESAHKTPVYYPNADYAREHGELEQYRASHWENTRCKKEMEEAIAQSFDGMHLDDLCVKSILKEYDPERIRLVLAATVQLKDWDGRFSISNKEWAGSIRMPQESANHYDRRWDLEMNTHPAVLDGYIKMMRTELQKMELAAERPSLRAELQKTEALKPMPHKVREKEIAR